LRGAPVNGAEPLSGSAGLTGGLTGGDHRGVTVTDSASRPGSLGGTLVPPAGVSHVIATADGPVHYTDMGEGPPLLLISAWGPQPGVTGWLTYRDVLPALTARYRCLVVDLPNFGLTGPVVFHEPVHDVAARAAFAVLDACGVDAAPVIGTSMGATTALDMALAAPDRVRALVIGACHASTGGDPYLLAPFPSEASIAYRDLLAAPDDTGVLFRLLRSLVYDEKLVTDDFVAEVAAFRAAHADHADAVRQSVSVPHSNVTSLAALAMPVLVIHGRFDRMVPFEQGLMITSHVPQADIVVFNRCGHWPPVERPDDFARHVTAFLAGKGL
jgi:2-hydroxy-6-oxonona-2,4-dienedioate hydrolase